MEACVCDDPAWTRFGLKLRGARDSVALDRGLLLGAICDSELAGARLALASLGFEVSDVRKTVPCAAGFLTVLAVCAMASLQADKSLAAFNHLHLAAGMLIHSARCLDRSPWPFTVAEILENYHALYAEGNGCAVGSFEDCMNGLTGWRFLHGGTGSLPRAVSEVPFKGHAGRRSPWRSQKLAVRDYIGWNVAGIHDEAQYWKYWLDRQKSSSWINPEIAMDWIYVDPCSYLKGRKAARVLNVGSGPIAPAPLQCGDQNVPVVSADGLARVYWRLYDDMGLVPPAVPVQCSFEQLHRCFGQGTFDLVHVRNALDHTFDAVEAIRNLLIVTRRGGTLLLHHGRNEAQEQKMKGMHQWSMDLDNPAAKSPGCMLKYRRDWNTTLNAEFRGMAKISVRLVRGEELNTTKTLERQEYIFVTMTRK